MRTTTLLTTLCAVVLIGCEPVSEPDPNVPDPSFAANKFVGSAYGSGNTTRPDYLPSPGYWRTFSFSARRYADGTAEGQFQFDHEGFSSSGHGAVTCMTFDGNTAWIGGIYTEHSNPARIGDSAVFLVRDGGEGASASPDEISYILAGVNADNFCTTQPSYPDWQNLRMVEVEAGNLVVRN